MRFTVLLLTAILLCLAQFLATSLSAVAAVGAAFASFFGHETTAEGGKTIREKTRLAPTHSKKSGLVAMGRSLPCCQATAILLLLHDDLLGWALLILHLCFHRVSLEPSISSFFQVPPSVLSSDSANKIAQQGRLGAKVLAEKGELGGPTGGPWLYPPYCC